MSVTQAEYDMYHDQPDNRTDFDINNPETMPDTEKSQSADSFNRQVERMVIPPTCANCKHYGRFTGTNSLQNNIEYEFCNKHKWHIDWNIEKCGCNAFEQKAV